MGRIPIVFDDDGNAYLEDETLQSIFDDKLQQVEVLTEREQLRNVLNQVEQREQAMIDQVVGSKDYYHTAFNRLSQARNWINNIVKQWQAENETPGYLRSYDAINLFAGSPVEEEFNKLYPNLNMVDVITSYDSEWHLQKALDQVSENEDLKTPEPSQVDEVADSFDPLKAAGLANEGSYSDKAIDALIKAMENEETDQQI